VQHNGLTPEKELKNLIYGSPFDVIIYKIYKLQKPSCPPYTSIAVT